MGRGVGRLLPVPLSPLWAKSYVSGFQSFATQILGDLGRSLAPFWASVSYLCNEANKCCLTSAHELLGGFHGSLKGTWNYWERGVWGIPSRMERPRAWNPKGVSVSLLCGFSISLYPAGEVAEAQGEDAVSNPGRQDLCPQSQHQPVGCPLSPQPSPRPTVWVVSAGRSHPGPGSGKLLASPPHPRLGAGLMQGVIS